ncbi:DUF4376 domain-containing protein [Vibrio ziniensis]|uniref:DUF4376 domain-containing protein n=1 Tax=Vibrio ziniensis TaxID=2711221 RepID=A0A6G7CH84_9VIBR|nr:DUF4376 domain-containing protein [Vibrio ziniensis]QIH41462.1 DUF4376 domain-containing protein [Vibrio ziniensis]
MKFETLAQVPEPIRQFYHEDIRHEPTGNKVSESYTYQDESGQDISAERLVDEYADVIYVVINVRHDLKSWSDVELAKARSTYETTRYFIEKAYESDLWAFHDAYLAWLESEPSLDDEESQELAEAAVTAWLELEPVNEVTSLESSLGKYHQELAKQYRESVIEGNIVVYDAEWQIDKEGRDNMNEAIAYADRTGLLGDTSRGWILADNTLRETTVDELRGVLNAYAERLGQVFEAYAVWRDGDKLEKFEF